MAFFKYLIACFLAILSFSVWADAVTQASPDVISDDQIVANIKTVVSRNPMVSGLNVVATSVNGLVRLVGVVETGLQASTLVEIVGATPGVKDIDTSNLTIRSNNMSVNEAFSDAILTAKVKGAFMRERLFDVKTVEEMPIQLQVTKGVVYLTGQVDDPMQIARAISIAKKVSGVIGVNSQLTVRTPGQ